MAVKLFRNLWVVVVATIPVCWYLYRIVLVGREGNLRRAGTRQGWYAGGSVFGGRKKTWMVESGGVLSLADEYRYRHRQFLLMAGIMELAPETGLPVLHECWATDGRV
ncbi:unnamed protein product [Tuber aestivum]|uniref:Uncharacterized protein n=1 Tax=Tuber aestivum TaxID=59557 RepID=A0A292PPC3_9PEZI|nr:unnamed protein product [Tuber aestivum]